MLYVSMRWNRLQPGVGRWGWVHGEDMRVTERPTVTAASHTSLGPQRHDNASQIRTIAAATTYYIKTTVTLLCQHAATY